jgi:aminoglycoside phosphotransferase (APT) family kinase protein
MTERRLRDLDDLTHGVRRWLTARDEHVAHVQVRRPSAGWSNETLLVDAANDDEDFQLVFRLPPLIAAVPNDDRGFEASVLTLLRAHGVLVPGVQDIERDDQWLGAPFLVMQHVPGRAVQEVPGLDPWLMDEHEAIQRSVQQQFFAALGEVHRITSPDRAAPAGIRNGLADELEYWHMYADWAADGAPSRRLCDILAWCDDHCPPVSESVLLWGDARLGNALYDKGTYRLEALLDWELASFGPPEMDLAWYLELEQLTALHAGKAPPGFATRDELLHAYTDRTQHEVADMGWHGIFALARSAALSDRHARVAERTGEFFPGSYGDENPLLMVAEWQISQWNG